MSNNEYQQEAVEEIQDDSSPKYLLIKILSSWPWIVLSIIIGVTAAYFYTKFLTPSYVTKAAVLIKDDNNSGGKNSELVDLTSLLNPTSSVDNEAQIIQTRNLMESVVKQLGANVTYYYEGSFRQYELYPSPFVLEFVSKVDTLKASKFFLTFNGNSIDVSNKTLKKTVQFEQPFFLNGIGVVKIKRIASVPLAKVNYSLSVAPFDQRVAEFMDALTVTIAGKQISVINLSFTYPIRTKAEAILNTLIKNYQVDNRRDKDVIADSTISFIQTRLGLVGKDLNDIEGNIQSFKQNNQLADMTEQSKLVVENTSTTFDEQGKIETQLNILDALESYLTDETKNKRIFPSSLVQDPGFSGLIERYNSLLVQRDKLLLSSTEDNPFIVNIDQQISGLRKDMLRNLISNRQLLKITLGNLNKKSSMFKGIINSVPQKERVYLGMARKQEIAQTLYVFLMQKREETAIGKTSNIPNSRIIDSPKAGTFPVGPKPALIVLLGFMLGLFFPISIIYLIDILNTRILTKDDIKRFTVVPVIGEISNSETISQDIVVTSQSRTAIAEQFRALRTNLQFFIQNPNEKVILLTSSMSGEGKSFIAINLGMVLAISGKRVLLMEMDLRKPTLSTKLNLSNQFGFTNYVISSTITSEEIIKPSGLNENLFVISSGPVPPNPAETILNERMGTLMAELDKQFDFIIIDAPPIGLVTDAQLLSKYSALALYVVRQNYTFKRQLTIPELLYREKKMSKIAIVVNDISKSNGYGYGYGYGYYDAEPKKGFFSKIFKKA